jgi:hypothetical protein
MPERSPICYPPWQNSTTTTFTELRSHEDRFQGLTEALTGDKHFEQAGFVALLRQ